MPGANLHERRTRLKVGPRHRVQYVKCFSPPVLGVFRIAGVLHAPTAGQLEVHPRCAMESAVAGHQDVRPELLLGSLPPNIAWSARGYGHALNSRWRRGGVPAVGEDMLPLHSGTNTTIDAGRFCHGEMPTCGTRSARRTGCHPALRAARRWPSPGDDNRKDVPRRAAVRTAA